MAGMELNTTIPCARISDGSAVQSFLGERDLVHAFATHKDALIHVGIDEQKPTRRRLVLPIMQGKSNDLERPAGEIQKNQPHAREKNIHHKCAGFILLGKNTHNWKTAITSA